jgi:16S rRNA U516 pseudouridylate synthase RsuA-like enzyme
MKGNATMDEERFNMSLSKFLKQVGVTSQREIERVVREGEGSGRDALRVKVVLTAEGTDLNHVVEGRIDLA